MKNNIILQHWNGTLPEWAKVAKKTVEKYCDHIGCQYQLVTGHPLGEKLGPNPQKLVYITEEYDQYEKVLMLDMDMIATNNYRNAFERPEIGVLHDRAMKGKSRTPPSAPDLFTLGMPIFFGNYIMTTKEQRISMREHADWDWLATKLVDSYCGDEMLLAWLLKEADLLKGMSIKEVCMRCDGNSYEDIYFRKETRWDRKFTNLAFGGDETCYADKDATFLHFGQSRKHSIPEYANKIFELLL
jgi:hypothetical protein